MGQIDQREIRPLTLQHLGSAPGDPLRTGQPCHRAPKGVEGKRAELSFKPFRQSVRCAVNAKYLVAVSAIVRFGRDAPIDRGALVEPPE
jgi:hypothetical protein